MYYEFLPENQTINSNQYCSQLDQLKAALDKKRLELVNRKLRIFHQDNTTWHFLCDDQAKTVTVWLGSSDSYNIFTRHCTFRCPFILVFKHAVLSLISEPLPGCSFCLEGSSLLNPISCLTTPRMPCRTQPRRHGLHTMSTIP